MKNILLKFKALKLLYCGYLSCQNMKMYLSVKYVLYLKLYMHIACISFPCCITNYYKQQCKTTHIYYLTVSVGHESGYGFCKTAVKVLGGTTFLSRSSTGNEFTFKFTQVVAKIMFL